MKKSSAFEAWKLLAGGLPRSIAMFAVAVVGICLGLALTIVGVGIPILAGTLAWCERMMREDQRRWGRWRRGEKQAVREPAVQASPAETPVGEAGEGAIAANGWSHWLQAIRRGEGYRAALYCIGQFPFGVALFTLSIAVPATVFGLMLEPVAYKVSMYLYGFQLYFDDEVMRMLLPPLTPFQRSLAAAVVGLFLFLFMAPLLRAFGRLHDGWVRQFQMSRSAASEAFASDPLPLAGDEPQPVAQFH